MNLKQSLNWLHRHGYSDSDIAAQVFCKPPVHRTTIMRLRKGITKRPSHDLANVIIELAEVDKGQRS